MFPPISVKKEECNSLVYQNFGWDENNLSSQIQLGCLPLLTYQLFQAASHLLSIERFIT